MDHRKALLVAGIATVICLASTADAAEFEYDTTLCFSGKHTTLADTQSFKFGTVAASGASLPGDRGEVTTFHCTGVWHEADGRYEETGFCEDLDAEGERTFARFVEVHENGQFVSGTLEYMGGTGSLAGISGGGSYEPLATYPQVKSGEAQECVESIGTYTLP